jgi:hypothetical protein
MQAAIADRMLASAIDFLRQRDLPSGLALFLFARLTPAIVV